MGMTMWVYIWVDLRVHRINASGSSMSHPSSSSVRRAEQRLARGEACPSPGSDFELPHPKACIPLHSLSLHPRKRAECSHPTLVAMVPRSHIQSGYPAAPSVCRAYGNETTAQPIIPWDPCMHGFCTNPLESSRQCASRSGEDGSKD